MRSISLTFSELLRGLLSSNLDNLPNERLLGLALCRGLDIRRLPVVVRSSDVLVNELGNAGVELVASTKEVDVVGAVEQIAFGQGSIAFIIPQQIISVNQGNNGMFDSNLHVVAESRAFLPS